MAERPELDSSSSSVCELCGREVSRLTKHHLCPREHGGTETALLCPACHRQVHALFTNRTLAAELSTLESLRREPEIRSYLKWVRRQSDSHIRVQKSRRRR
jgi:5-methylcytosine-specific restriction enzyme A